MVGSGKTPRPPGSGRGSSGWEKPTAGVESGAGSAVPVPRPAAQRISLYLRHLESQGQETISSRELGAALGLTAAQVRKDLGHFGFPGVGYKIPELIREIRKILGTDHVWNVAFVGVGNLGMALARYRGFEKRGFQIVAYFDADSRVIGRKIHGAMIQSIDRLAEEVKAKQIQLGILAVPAAEAQAVAGQMVAAGIQGILNFAPRAIDLPAAIRHVSVDLAIQLEQLTLGLSLVNS